MNAQGMYRALLLSMFGGKAPPKGKFKTANVAAAINRSKDQFFDLVSGRIGTDEVAERWLSPLIHYDDRLKLLKRGEHFDIFERPVGLAKVETTYVIAKKGEFEKRIVAFPMPIKSVEASVPSHYWKASFDFEDTWRHLVNDGVRVMHSGDFIIKRAYSTWVEKIEDIHFPSVTDKKSYVYIDGSLKEKDMGVNLGPGAYGPILEGAEFILSGNGGDLSLAIQKSINKRNLI